jgi:endonuclease/exonuclease/phosphatase family metal-dependent hydrolase
VARIHQAHPDVIAVQEGTSWVNPGKTELQVQSLVDHLNGQYAIGPTAIPPAAPNFRRTGVFVLYDRAKYQAVGEGGWWNDGNYRWSAYQELENRATGARFVVVSAHLLPNLGAAGDVKREQESRTLVGQGTRLAAQRGVPVIYGGDFNSDATSTYTYDAPGRVMTAAGIGDAFDLAPSHVSARFNSFNKYLRRPPATGAQIDRLFAAPGVAVTRWGMVMQLRHGSVVGPIPSDHNPVYADFLVPAPTP